MFGPGDIAQAHTKDEWIELEQVQLAAEAYFQIAVDLGRVEPIGSTCAVMPCTAIRPGRRGRPGRAGRPSSTG